MVPAFAGNEAVLFPGIRERIMTRIPGRPGNGSPGMHFLVSRQLSNLVVIVICLDGCRKAREHQQESQ